MDAEKQGRLRGVGFIVGDAYNETIHLHRLAAKSGGDLFHLCACLVEPPKK